MEEGLDTYASFYDLTKAFDCVSHDILLQKLSHYKFDPGSICLIQSYLNQRTQYVLYNGCNSNTNLLKHGVPQGSVLGPILFLIYINDLAHTQGISNLILFADDTTNLIKYHPSNSIEASVSDVQSNIQDWFTANKLSMNTLKTQILNFSQRTSEPQFRSESSVKFLGVHLDPKFTWEQHATQLGSKLSSIIYLIRTLSESVTRKMLLTAYHGHFASRISYAILNWGHSAHSNYIFKLQRRCIRVIGGLGYRDCCRELFGEYRIMTLPSLYIFACLSYLKKNLNLYRYHYEVHDHLTRNNSDLLPGYSRLARTRTGPGYYCVKFFNVLPRSIRDLDCDLFLRKIKDYLLKKSFYSIEEYINNQFSDLV